MRRITAAFFTGIMLLFILTGVVSGERAVSENKTPTKIEQRDRPTKSAMPATAPSIANEPLSDVISPVVETPMDADDYQIPWQSINAGGGDMQSTNYQMSSSAGQSAIGHSTSTNYQMGGGYWYGMGEGGGDCYCGGAYRSFGDITCDNAVNPVDVVQMVNFVYKNIDNRCPPPPHNTQGWNCPSPPGDVTCDTQVNPVDVVMYVNYVYKNITPSRAIHVVNKPSVT